ncbi:MAG: ribose-5-phosphate isomerase RpiA [Hellea sp.]|jgi:ribose 5-phosphate isomerase A
MQVTKENAALAALDYVEDGMILGLGSGSTAEIFIKHLGMRIADGMKIIGVPTSKRTEAVAIKNGVPLIEPDKVSSIQLTIDGADEVDPGFSLIKGGGACLLREKIIAHASDKMIVIADDSKIVDTLGKYPLPVEVDPFAMALTAEKIYSALVNSGCESAVTVLRQKINGQGPLVTDGGHFLLDCSCKKIPDPAETAFQLSRIPGVMEHGLFVGLASIIIVGFEDHAKVMEITEE